MSEVKRQVQEIADEITNPLPGYVIKDQSHMFPEGVYQTSITYDKDIINHEELWKSIQSIVWMVLGGEPWLTVIEDEHAVVKYQDDRAEFKIDTTPEYDNPIEKRRIRVFGKDLTLT